MTNIAIVDDDVEFMNMIKNKITDLNSELSVMCFQNPYDFLQNIEQINYVLLDIELPQLDGISLAKQLRNNKIAIFFITVHDELMIKAFGKNVEGFIIKNDLEEGINRFLKYIYKDLNNKSIEIFTSYGDIKLNLDNIIYIKYSLRDIEYYLINGKSFIQKNTNLKDIMCFLNENFILINRNIIININYIDDFKSGYILIRNQKFKVSRRKIKKVKIKLIEMRLNDEIS